MYKTIQRAILSPTISLSPKAISNQGISIRHKPHRLFSASSASFNTRVIQDKIKLPDNQEINYGKIGQGPQVVLCIPGIFGTIESDFEAVMKKFNPDKFTLMCFDPPGYGKSRPPRRDVGKNPYLKDGETGGLLMKTLGIPKYSVIGWSNGGTAAIHLIAANSKNVEKLIFWGSPCFINDYSVQLSEMMGNSINWIPSRWQMMVDIYGEAEMHRMLEDFHEYIVACRKSNSFRVDLLLSAIQCPTLVLHGKLDMMCPIEHPKMFHENIAKSILEVWPKGQHDLHLEFQDQFVKRVETFLLTAK